MNSYDGVYTEALDGTGVDREEAGGKAWALERLIEHGFPVPPAVLVRAAAYRAAVADPPLAEFLRALRSDAPGAEVGEDAVAAAFAAAALPGEVEAALHATITAALPVAPWAVRSSATGADFSGHSFAGQYRTVMGVTDVTAALCAVRGCWASLWFPEVREYRRRSGIGDDGLAMAVIVQQQVRAEWSGLMLTRDPRGEGDTMRIESAPGAGGEAPEPTVGSVHHVHRDTMSVSGIRDGAPVFLEDLARLGLRIERRFGEPQEVAWSVAGGAIWVVQSRAITSERAAVVDADRFDTAVPGQDTFSPQGVAEMLPGVLDPLTWSINARMVEDALRALLRRSHADVPPVDRPLIGRFQGRAALNLSALGAAITGGGGSGVVEREYLGTEAEPGPEEARPRISVGGLVRAWRERRRIEDDVAVLTTAVACLPLVEPDPSGVASGDLIAYRRELRELAARGVLAEVAASAAATTAFRNLEAVLQRWLGTESGAIEAQRIISGGLADKSIGPQRIRTIAALIESTGTPALRTVLATSPPSEARARVAALGPKGSALVAAVEQAGHRFGSIAVYAGPTFAEEPIELWRVAAAAVGAPRSAPAPSVRAAVDRSLGVQAMGRRWRTIRVLTGQFVDVRRRILYRLAADAVRFLGMREAAKSSLLTLGGMERRAIVAAAQRLVRSGHLDSVADVGLLDDAELDQMLLGAEPVGRLTLERRLEDYTRARALGPLAASFGGAAERRPEPRVPGTVLSGWCASPGRATGRVRHLHTAADGDRLEPGEIIVAVTTDPTWTPLFLRAGGIVLEQGGPLSHAAIVARELGIPAVLNLAGAMESLIEGATVTVDGTTGVVTPLADAAMEEVGA